MEKRILISKAVYIMKAIAIVFVAMAHCTYIDADIQRVTDIIGTIGVPIFLITGGLYYNNNRSWGEFVKNKLKRIVVPWILWGCGTYILHIVNDHSSIVAFDLFKWIIGYKTWLYYVPVVLFCYLIFRFSTSIKYTLTVFTLSIISYFVTSMWGIDLNVITSCQNPLNWIGFFAVGVLLQQAGMKSHILFEKRRRIAAGISAASLIIFSISYFLYSTLLNITPSYWNAFSIVFELNACVVIYYLSLWLAEKKQNPLQ